jgi:quaternary ammonium compound-resistance protein SugE
MMNPWIALIAAGMFEIGFTSFMKLSEGFTKWAYIGPFIVSAVFSFWLLTEAMKSIPLGTAYAVWTGIGAMGTAILGILFFGDPATLGRVFFLFTLVGSIIGLKLAS